MSGPLVFRKTKVVNAGHRPPSGAGPVNDPNALLLGGDEAGFLLLWGDESGLLLL